MSAHPETAAARPARRRARPQAKARRRRIPPETPVRPAEPRIAIVGRDQLLCRRVHRALSRLVARFQTIDWQEAFRRLDDFDGLIFAERLRDFDLEAATRRAREQCPQLPLFVVFDPHDGQATRVTRKLYRAGASAVFEWPRERPVLARLVAEVLGMRWIRGPATEPDRALQRTVRAHLRVRRPPLPSVRLSVRSGAVEMTGAVSRLSEKLRLVDVVSEVPGVRSVLDRGLHVVTDGTSDRTLRRRIVAHLRATLGEVDLRPRLSVRQGRVRLTLERGLVHDRSELVRSLARLAGIRELEVEILPEPTPVAASTARSRARRALDLLFPRERRIELEMVDGTLELSGRVSSLRTKRAIERELEQHDGVVRLVNKLQVGR